MSRKTNNANCTSYWNLGYPSVRAAQAFIFRHILGCASSVRAAQAFILRSRFALYYCHWGQVLLFWRVSPERGQPHCPQRSTPNVTLCSGQRRHMAKRRAASASTWRSERKMIIFDLSDRALSVR